MPLETETKDKLFDGAVVAAKITGMLGLNVLSIGLASALGSRVASQAIPRPINMWNNQRSSRARSRAIRDLLVAADLPLDYNVRVTRANKEWKIYTIAWAAYHTGINRWELLYHLSKAGFYNFKNGDCAAIEFVDDEECQTWSSHLDKFFAT